ncbi:MAG TPA: leukotriene A4 hydrolase C-terminal domain-containing protein, partial [Luteimonas sp.]|nr:leukotriene A4 hydrolase C-terminal domain-containing protein [Luteimonas sp.]
FTGTANGEIAMRWYPLAIRSGYVQANEAVSEFVQRIGRRKLIMPVYEALVKTEAGLALAKDAFEKARPGYHPITTASVEKVIAEAKPAPSPAPVAPEAEADQASAPDAATPAH